jgi:phospholipid/cholesterol/gamma-HCH transport system substrate-binding protein
MRLNRLTKIQLALFAVISTVAGAVMFIGYVQLPAMFGVGRYTVTMQLPSSGGLYEGGNVMYRGTQVGKVKSVNLTERGRVNAILNLNSAFRIPSNLRAEVHSQSAIGEQYVSLEPRDSDSPPLKAGDFIPLMETSVPPPIDSVVDAVNRGLQAIPGENLKTVIDESATALGGLGPELSRIVKGSTALTADARANLNSLTSLIDQSGPVLDSQTATRSDIESWAAHLADLGNQLRNADQALSGVITNGAPAADEARQLVERLRPTLPIILANLSSVGHVALVYRADIEQILVLVPQSIAMIAATAVPNHYNSSPFSAGYLDFNLDLNLPPPCTTGFLPASQRRAPDQTDAPDRPEGYLYCRVPQDSQQDVRGARNIPCETRPGKRAPTVKMCESDENYVPLNDGNNWKGDPNATLSGQGVPQLSAAVSPSGATPDPKSPTSSPTEAPPLAVADYDPTTGSYIGPDGHVYTQADLGANASKDKTWQSMLTPPN